MGYVLNQAIYSKPWIFLVKSFRRFEFLGAMVVLVTFLCAISGCASSISRAGTQTDMLTASDETDGQKRAKIRLELALGYLEQGQVTIALDETKQAITADPASADAYNLRGLIYMRLNDFNLARDSFVRALAFNPKDGNIFHNFGCVHLSLMQAILLRRLT